VSAVITSGPAALLQPEPYDNAVAGQVERTLVRFRAWAPEAMRKLPPMTISPLAQVPQFEGP
jgi:hypothetical protein